MYSLFSFGREDCFVCTRSLTFAAFLGSGDGGATGASAPDFACLK